MKKQEDEIIVTVKQGKKRVVSRTPLAKIDRFVFVYNRQFTNAPNTTQLASGAGVDSAAGNNAAIASPNTQQQQSVGAGGIARNKGLKDIGKHYGSKPFPKPYPYKPKEVVVVINDQEVKLPRRSSEAAATQVASGGGKHSTAGTNSAIESAGTKQQHAVGGGSGSTGSNSLLGKARKPCGRCGRYR